MKAGLEKLCSNEQKTMCLISQVLKNKSVLLVAKKRPPSCTYSVIGFYLYHILKHAGVDVTFKDVDKSRSVKREFDVGIYANYETKLLIRFKKQLLKEFLKQCKYTIFYANVVASTRGFDRYAVSRECFLNPSNKWYRYKAYKPGPPKENFRLAKYVGRGVDPEFLKPSQIEFKVCIDAMRKKSVREAIQIIEKIKQRDNTIPILSIGVSSREREKFVEVAEIYKSSSVYLSTIKGIYEMPLVEAQAAGNHIISVNDYLAEDLCCRKTTYVLYDPDSIVDKIISLKKVFFSGKYDFQTSRDFASQWKWTTIVNRLFEDI